ncbi:hypothetical protein MLD52_19785 [Puniceicoccaceae bacterium K14]|nr:hypothetical protein [Puniceicoccaceae bacterium K14]
MKFCILLLLWVASVSASVVQVFEAKEITVPYFNKAGNLSHRLTAEKGNYGEGNPRLFQVVIEMFSGGEEQIEVGRIIADEAELVESENKIVGQGRAQYLSEEFDVQGYDFEIDLDTNTLLLKRDCTASNDEYDFKSVSMIVEYDESKTVGYNGIRKLIAKEELEIFSKGIGTTEFDEAYTELAIYDGLTGIIDFPEEVEFVRDKQKGSLKNLKIETNSVKSGTIANPAP